MRRSSRGAPRREKVVRYLHGGVEREVAAEEIFYALGRAPEREGLDLEQGRHRARAGRRRSRSTAALRTSNPNIYAVGDVTGEYMLVHVAIYQGEVAARNACLNRRRTRRLSLGRRRTRSSPIRSSPRSGMSEKELRASSIAYVRGRYDFAEHGKAQCLGKTKGFVKMMADRDERPHSGRGGARTARLGADSRDHRRDDASMRPSSSFMRIPHLHPTLAEIWTYPAEDVRGGARTEDSGRRAGGAGDEREPVS